MKEYFATLQLSDGRFVTFVYQSAHRKNASENMTDFFLSLERYNKEHGTKLQINDAKYTKRKTYRGKRHSYRTISDWVYLMNKKNMDEECFGDCEIIDLRE